MTTAATEQPTEDLEESATGDQQDQGTQGDAGSDSINQNEKDWESEFKAQQRINRDIERRNGKRLKELEQELADAKKAKVADGEEKPDLDALRTQIRDEAKAEVLKDRALDKIEAKAAGKFKDPEDALLRLGKNVDDFISDGKIDLAAIEDALNDLLEKRPDFGVTQGDSKRFKGTGDGGTKGNAGKPQLTEADVKKLAAQGKHEEIEQARLDGRLNELLDIK